MIKVLKKANLLLLLLAILSCLLLADCKKATRLSQEDVDTDSVTNRLRPFAFNNPDSVITVAHQFSKTLESTRNKAKVVLIIANATSLLGKYDSTISIATRGLELSKEDAQVTGGLYNEIGISYDYKADYKNALTNYQLAEDYFQQAKDTIGYIKVRNNIGLIYQNTGELKRAAGYFNECLQLSREKKYTDEAIMALSNLASVETEMGNYKIALGYFQDVLASDIKSGNEAYISYSYHNVGEAYKHLKQFDSALYYFSEAIRLKEKMNLQSALVNSYKGYADLLTEINRLPEASFYLNKAFQLARETGTTDYLQDCYYLKSRLAEKTGDFKTAYIAQDSFHFIKDSLSNAKFTSELIIKEKDHELKVAEELRKREMDEYTSEKIYLILFIFFLLAVAASLFLLLKKQKKLNKQLEHQKQLVEAGLAQRSQLLSFLAHEIRNPLGGIQGLTDLLLSENPTPNQKELLDYQKKASVHLLALMNDVLDYQKLGSGKVELNSIRFNLRDVLYQVYALYQGEIREKKLSYDLDFDETIPGGLIGDPIRITQVFSNLLNNAIKFTDKGTITIAAKLINRTADTATIFCKVTDSGVGIPKEEQDKIFELYVQSSKNKSAQLGTGLGLSIVRNLLSLMNSSIELHSEAGIGTTFSFTVMFRTA